MRSREDMLDQPKPGDERETKLVVVWLASAEEEMNGNVKEGDVTKFVRMSLSRFGGGPVSGRE